MNRREDIERVARTIIFNSKEDALLKLEANALKYIIVDAECDLMFVGVDEHASNCVNIKLSNDIVVETRVGKLL